MRFGDARLKDLLHAAPQHIRICSVRLRDRVAQRGGVDYADPLIIMTHAAVAFGCVFELTIC